MFREIAIACFLEGMYWMERSRMRNRAPRIISRSKFLDEKKFVVKFMRSQDWLRLEDLAN